jgi:hypothetical protein
MNRIIPFHKVLRAEFIGTDGPAVLRLEVETARHPKEYIEVALHSGFDASLVCQLLKARDLGEKCKEKARK